VPHALWKPSPYGYKHLACNGGPPPRAAGPASPPDSTFVHIEPLVRGGARRAPRAPSLFDHTILHG